MHSYLAAFKYESKVYLFICYYKLNPIFFNYFRSGMGGEWERNGSGSLFDGNKLAFGSLFQLVNRNEY